MFILAKSFINKKGEMFLKIFPRQYPSIETAHAAMQSDYQEELKKTPPRPKRRGSGSQLVLYRHH